MREKERIALHFLDLERCNLPFLIFFGRAIEVLCLIQKGLLSKEIADRLCISIHTVNIHRQNLLRKLGVQNSIEAIRLGQEIGLLG